MATNTSSNTFDLVKKSAKIGNLTVDKLTVSTEWKPFTPTLTGATLASATQEWRYRIVGRTLHVKGGFVSTGGGSTGVYAFTLPSGCESRAASFPYTNGCLGAAVVQGTTAMGIGVVGMLSATTFAITYQNSATTVAAWGNATSSANLKLDAASAVTLLCEFSVELLPTCAALYGNTP